jgi:hypothetical protein
MGSQNETVPSAARRRYDLLAKRCDGYGSQPEVLESKWNSDDCQAKYEAKNQVCNGHPKLYKDEQDDVPVRVEPKWLNQRNDHTTRLGIETAPAANSAG